MAKITFSNYGLCHEVDVDIAKVFGIYPADVVKNDQLVAAALKAQWDRVNQDNLTREALVRAKDCFQNLFGGYDGVLSAAASAEDRLAYRAICDALNRMGS